MFLVWTAINVGSLSSFYRSDKGAGGIGEGGGESRNFEGMWVSGKYV